MSPYDADRMANSVDPDQTAPDLGLHCLPRQICLKTWDHYGRLNNWFDMIQMVLTGPSNLK